MRALFTQFSGLIGLLTFLNQLMSQAPLEKTLFLGLSAGLSVYLVLIIGDLAIHRILEHAQAMQPKGEVAEGENPAVTTNSAPTSAPDPQPLSRTPNKEALAA